MGLLRFLFAISVISAHTSPIFGLSFIGGKMAVNAFFMLSGFYMALILEKKYSSRKNGYMLFITNRVLRIFPTYFVVLLLTLLSSAIFLWMGQASKLTIYQQYREILTPLHLAYLFFIHIFILGMDTQFGTGVLFVCPLFGKKETMAFDCYNVFKLTASRISLQNRTSSGALDK